MTKSESELSLFDKKFTSPSCRWFEKRISPRESVWPTLSLPSLSFLPPLPHNLSGLSSSSGSDPLVTNSMRRVAPTPLMLMRIWLLWMVTNLPPSIPSTSLRAPPAQMVIEKPSFLSSFYLRANPPHLLPLREVPRDHNPVDAGLVPFCL